MELISREQAIDALYSVDEYNSRSVKAIKQLPSIQPKRGRWIGKYPVTSACSECGFLIHDSKVKAFAYCPNCGADMRQREE